MGGTFQPKRERHPPHSHAPRSCRSRCPPARRLPTTRRYSAAAEAGIDARAAPLQPIGIDAGVLDGTPARLQEEALLRVHGPRVDRLDAEEARVELVDAFQEAPATVHRPLGLRVARDPVPDAGVLPSIRDRGPPALQQIPEGLKVLSAGEAAGHPHDGNSLRSIDRGALRRRLLRRWRRGLACIAELPG